MTAHSTPRYDTINNIRRKRLCCSGNTVSGILINIMLTHRHFLAGVLQQDIFVFLGSIISTTTYFMTFR